MNADYPDSDVVRHRDKFYMISSKKHMSPGMVILESYDMVNWKIINHVYDKITWGDEYNWDKMKGYKRGVWAGDLAFHDGTWYCYVIDPSHGLFVTTTKDIYGKWSVPKKMLSQKKVGDDPSVFWDDENKEAWLIANIGRSRTKEDKDKYLFKNAIFKMSWDGMSLEDEGTDFYKGTGAEASKIYKINKQWFIFLSEWSTKPNGEKEDRKQIALRSKTNSIYGPYDKKILLEKGNGFERSCSQGSLNQAPDGSWWYYHQLIQNTEDPFQGRPQCLQPVEWIDGWPIIGKDIDNDGIGEPLRRSKMPNIKATKKLEIQTSDDFSESKLGHQWEWNHNPRNSHWSLTERKGWLRLKASSLAPLTKYGFHKGSPLWRASNTLSQRIMGTKSGTAIAKFDVTGMKKGQKAGFVRFGGISHVIGVKMDEEGSQNIFFMDDKGTEIVGPKVEKDIVYFKTTNIGKVARFQYSYDNKHFDDFGNEFELGFGRWSGDRLGVFCWNDKEESGYVDIDWFLYEYE
ncbi:alpha-L-arabinofuranosidase, GH43 family [Polaribacter sp. Hel1_85]|nr:alpha-L-arabinofuranosidase, GH43 family [Polaribacter sp. Hel1_85]